VRIRPEIFFALELPYRERLVLERTIFEGGSGPRVAIASGIHGDELEGLYVCHRLAAWLERLGKERPDALLGQVELYPALNPLGLDTLKRSVPIYDVDLNRNFPGHAEGLLPQRVADAVMRALRGASLVVDIHASNIYLREIPQVRISKDFEATLVPLAREMNLDLIWVHGAATVLENTIAHSLNASGVPCLVVEMGVGMRVTPVFAEQVVLGILRAWQALGVLADDLEIEPNTHVPLIAHDGNVHYLNAEVSGLFVPSAAHWMAVGQGQLLGRIVSPLRGEVLAEVRSPVEGVLFTLREYPLVYEGSLLARIMETQR
jgi:predicted deacylase